MSDAEAKTVLVIGANGYIGNAVARAFVRSGWITYGLVRKESAIPSLAAEEIIPLLGSPADTSFLKALENKKGIFNVVVSTTEDLTNYIPHYKDIITLIRTIATTSNVAGIRPLVLFTSGCKDYGMMDQFADSPNLAPHTEESPLNYPPWAAKRAEYAIKTFENVDLLDTIVLRPTNVYGLSSSYYGDLFRLAVEAKKKGVWEIKENPQTILHALHVDDCGEAYVKLAEFPDRDVIKGQVYNISSYRFETLDEVAQVLAKEYEIPGGVKYVPGNFSADSRPDTDFERILLGFSQWTGSDKLRRDVRWKDKRLLFSRAVHQYRLAYESAISEGYAKNEFWKKI